ncbi:hypothetical protein EJB05_37139, partial [Eragrostis curvula]
MASSDDCGASPSATRFAQISPGSAAPNLDSSLETADPSTPCDEEGLGRQWALNRGKIVAVASGCVGGLRRLGSSTSLRQAGGQWHFAFAMPNHFSSTSFFNSEFED